MPKNDDTPTVDVEDSTVEVYPPHGDEMSKVARKLLDAAEKLGHDVEHAVHSIGGGFRVPRAVAEEAGVMDAVPDPEPLVEPDAAKAPVKAAPTPAVAVEKGAAPGGGDAAN